MRFSATDFPPVSGSGLPPSTMEQAGSDFIGTVAGWAHAALIREVDLTPKPGLVDRRNNGAHHDMDHRTFIISATAIAPFFRELCHAGICFADAPAPLFLEAIRPIGIACERAMLKATGGVNTHKGAIFSLGIFCATAGRLTTGGSLPCRRALCSEVARICSGLVASDLVHVQFPRTAGERLFHLHGIAGIRGEAASGYRTVRMHALPVFLDMAAKGYPEETALLQSLLSLMAHNQDTNLFGRGGIEGMQLVRERAARILANGGMLVPGGMERMIRFDDELTTLNLSPGGSADLLAVCWFLSRFPAGR